MSLGAKKLTASKHAAPKGVLAKAVLAKTAKVEVKAKVASISKPVAKPMVTAITSKPKPNGKAEPVALRASAKPVPSRAALVNKPAPKTHAPKQVIVVAKPTSEPVAIDPKWLPFQELLLAKKAELGGSLSEGRISSEAQNNRVAEEDQAAVSHEEFISSKRNAMDFKILRLVKAALDRIAHGEYGICHACEEDISEKRLRAIPWAEYCVHCQDNHAHDEPEETEAAAGGAAPALQVWNW